MRQIFQSHLTDFKINMKKEEDKFKGFNIIISN